MKDPLTDPSSLIAYRLANGETSLSGKRQRHKARSTTSNRSAAFVLIGLFVAVLTVLIFIFSR